MNLRKIIICSNCRFILSGQDGTKKELTILFDENDLVKKFNTHVAGFLH